MHRRLFSRVRIGSLELKNRLAMAPMGVELADADGRAGEAVARYYEERARGGVGLIITENAAAMYPYGANSAHELGVSSDAFLPGLRAVTEAVHRHGAKIAVQLAHHGKVARVDTAHGREQVMPSVPRAPMRWSGPLDLSVDEMTWMAKAAGGGQPVIREATFGDIAAMTEGFADAAHRARRAGFDGVEIHAAHGYIFSEFHSGASNFRTDAYGGPIENRARFLCEVIAACKARAGADFPVWCRLDAVEFGVEGGIRFSDALRTAEHAERAGADAISISAYANPIGAGFTLGPIVHAPAGYAAFAARLKERVRVPVIVAGRISPDVGEELVANEKADIIAMARPLLADPELPAKLEVGRAHDVRPCIYCYVCVAQPFFDRRVKCAVNPVTAHETEWGDVLRTRAAQPKRVLVVGGGPAGMEAARVAALRGHDVVLCEKGPQLGGTLRFAALSYEPNEALLRWLERQVADAPIDVRLGCAVDAACVREIAPDVVLAAVGAKRERSMIPGAHADHVLDGDDLRELLLGQGRARGGFIARLLVSAGQALGLTRDPAWLRAASHLYMPIGRRVVIVGGGLVGIELAEFLAARRRDVTVLDEGGVAALEMAHPRRWRVLHELREAGVGLVQEAVVTGIERDCVRYRVGDADHTTPADSVVIATGLGGDPDAIAALEAAGVPVLPIGDGTGVGYLEGAIRDGFHAARTL